MLYLLKEEIIKEEDRQYIYSLYEKGYSCKKISTMVDYSHDHVWQTLKRAGYKTSRNVFELLTDEEIDDICRLYINKIPTSKILEKYPRIKCQNTIIKIVKAKGVKVRKPGVAPIIKAEDFFETINSEEKAYIVGLLIADGSVIFPSRQNRNPCWSITLKDNDKYLLEQIKDIIGTNKKICHSRNESILSVTSLKMVLDLSQYGIVPRKSFKTYYPSINPVYNRHLIRGIFDGDGCISGNICSFYGTTELLIGIQNILKEEVGIPPGKITIRETNGANSFSFSARDNLKSYYHYIYDNATIYLQRKYDKFKNLNL